MMPNKRNVTHGLGSITKMRIKENAGFTLTELMIVVAIIGILAGIAIPSYLSSMYKSRRADATTALTSAAQALERYYTVNNAYTGATLGTGGVYPSVTPNGFYTLTFTAQGTSNFTLQANPLGGQASDSCGALTLNDQGQRGITGSGNINHCW